MSWEDQILDVCEKYEISPDVYNQDSDAKEFVARILGFPSFECFELLPEPADILDGRGADLLVGHRMQQLPLIKDCLALISRNYYVSESIEDFRSQSNNFVKYVKEHFDYEYILVAKQLMEEEFKNIQKELNADE